MIHYLRPAPPRRRRRELMLHSAGGALMGAMVASCSVLMLMVAHALGKLIEAEVGWGLAALLTTGGTALLGGLMAWRDR